MSEILNFYSGTIDITPRNVDQRGADLGNFDADLASIEYIVDVHAKRNDLITALNSVYIRYATGSTADDLVDTLASGNTHTESVKTYQHDDVKGTPGATTSIRSFDINFTNEVVGRMPAQLKGKYVTNLDTGADSILIKDNSHLDFSVVNDGTANVTSDLSVTFNSVAEAAGDLVGATGYDNLNLFAGAIARAVSAQMPGTGDDENILRVLIENDDYFNILGAAVQGAVTSGGSTKSVNGLLHSNEVSTGYGMSMQDLLDKVFDSQLPSSRPLGHEILLALFDKAPPQPNVTLAAVGTDNTTDKRPWEISTTPGDAMFKLAYMDNLVNPATAAPIDVNLQFVVKTALTMVMRDATTLTTTVSPSGDTHVKILVNLIFDRSDDATVNQ